MRRIPWWGWSCAAVFVTAAAAGVVLTSLRGLEDANALAGIGSFVLAAAALILALVPVLPKRAANTPAGSRVAHLLLYVDGPGSSRPARVRQVDDYQLGVRRAVESVRYGPTRYVPRDMESQATQAMLAGGMVVFTGPATAGKSRTAIQLVKQLFPDRYLYVPAGTGALMDLLNDGHQFNDAVIWLDDLERYFGDRGIDIGMLARLCPADRTDIVVMGTLRHMELERHGVTEDGTHGSQPDGQAKPHPSGTELLKQLKRQGRLHPVGSKLSSSEITSLDKVDTAHGDTRLLTAAGSGRGFGEYLGAGVELMERWNSRGNALETVGAAVISAAVDARRAGFAGTLPATVLTELTEEYLSGPLRTRADAPSPQQGMEWAARSIAGTDSSSCLIPHTDGGYRAEDYLADRADAPPSPVANRPIPNAVWQAVLQVADIDQTVDIGHAAYFTGNYDVARCAWGGAAADDNAQAMFSLGVLLVEHGNTTEAHTWYQTAAETGHTGAMYNLALLLVERDDMAAAETWYRRACEAGNSDAMYNLGNLLVEHGNTTEAQTWYQTAAETGNSHAMYNLGNLLEEHGNTTEAQTWYQTAASAGHTNAMINLALLLKEHGNTTEAQTWYQTAAEAGNPDAMYNLALLLFNHGRRDEAETWYRTAAEAGDTGAMNNLGNLLKEHGNTTEAEIWYRTAISAGHANAVKNLGVLLAERGDEAGAKQLSGETAALRDNDEAA